MRISHKGNLYFERYNNIEIKDINSFLREYYNNEIVDIDNIFFLSDPLFFLQDNISNNEYIKLKSSHEYEKRTKLEQEFQGKSFGDELRHNLNYDEDVEITILCNIQDLDNSIEEKRIYIQIRGEEQNIKNYIDNPFIHYDFDGFLLYILIPEKTDWFIAPSNDAINDVLALRDEDKKLENLNEDKFISIYNEACKYDNDEYIYTFKEEFTDHRYILNLYFNRDDILKYLRLATISIYIKPNSSKIIKYCDKKIEIENNGLIIKNKTSKLKQSIENYNNLKESEKIDTQNNESVSSDDNLLLKEIFPTDISIDEENKKLVLKIYKFFEKFKSNYQADSMLKDIDILKYKILGFNNKEIANELKINKNYSANKTYISRAKTKVLKEINTKFDSDFPYVQHNNLNEYINNYRNSIESFFNSIKEE